MPKKGSKVGEAYIELNTELDEKSLAKSEAKLKRSVEKAENDLKYRRIRNNQEAVQKAHLDAIREEKKRSADIEKIHRIHLKRVEKEENDLIRRRKGKRGKDGGVLGFGEGIENVLSVLPGQIEKLFRSPALAAGGVAAGLAIVQAATQTIAVGLAAGVASGAILGGFIAQIKKDPQLQSLAQSIGTTFVSGITEATTPLKDNIGNTLVTIRKLTEDTFKNLNFGNLGGAIDKLTGGFDEMVRRATPGLQKLSDAGAVFLEEFAKYLPSIGDSLTYVGNVIYENRGAISGFVHSLADITNAAIRLVGALIDVSSKVQGIINVISHPTQITKNAGFLADVVGVLDKIPGVNLDNTALRQFDTAMNGAADTAQHALPQFNAVGLSLQAQADAFDQATAAQQQYDSKLKSGLDGQIQVKQAIADINETLKNNGRTLDINTQKGRDNVKAIQTGFQEIKQGLATQVAQGKITADQAEANFRRQTDAILKTAGATGTAKRELQLFRDQLTNFPAGVHPSVTLEGFANAQQNIKNLRDSLAGLNGQSATIRANSIVNKNTYASGGIVSGPGTGTSDSVPAMLSNGEGVLTAKTVSRIGPGAVNALNSGGSVAHFATGGVVGQGRGKTASQVSQFNLLTAQIAQLNKTIGTQTKTFEKFVEAQKAATEQFGNFVNLAQAGEGAKTAGDVLGQFRQRAARAGQFQKKLAGLRKKGLSTAALQQIADAGPESDLAKLLGGPQGLQAVDVQEVNRLLAGAGAYGNKVAETLSPGGTKSAQAIAAAKKAMALKQKQAAKLKAPKARGATISYAGGRVSALFSQAELQQQQLKQGTYVTVIIDGKEVRAIVKAEANKQTAKANRNLRAGRR